MKNNLVRFIISGSATTGVDFILYILLSIYIPIYISKAVSMFIAMTLSFFINRFWSFNNTNITIKRSISRFVLCQVINLLVNTTVNYSLYILSHNKIISFIGATFFAMIINFILQKNYVFPSK